MLKREWGAESNGKLLHLFIPSKSQTMVPGFVVEDLPLGRTAALVPEIAVKDLSWAEHSMMMIFGIILSKGKGIPITGREGPRGCGCKCPHIHSHDTRKR